MKLGLTNTWIRKGSIPIVLGIGSLLGAVACSSALLTSSTARTEKRVGLHATGLRISRAACEETLMKISNGVSNYHTGQRVSYPARATSMMYGEGVNVEPVQVYADLLTVAADASQADLFYSFIAAGPRFSRAHQDDWESRVPAALKPLLDAPKGIGVQDGPRSSFAQQLKGCAGGEARQALESLPVLSKGVASHSDSELADFKTGTGSKMDGVCRAIAAAAAAVSAGGCGTKVQRELSQGMLAALAGCGAPATSRVVQDFDAAARKGNVYGYTPYMLALQTSTRVNRSGLAVDAPFFTQRVMCRYDVAKAFTYLAGRFAAYVAVHHHLTPADLARLGWINSESNPDPVPDRIFGELMAKAKRDMPYPYPIATSVSEVK